MTEPKAKKVRKIKPYGPTYKRLAAEEAAAYCPDIKPCRKCCHPVISGYCCAYCGTDEP